MMKFETRTSLEFENEGQKLFAILHRPLDVKNPPIVVMFHGFGGHKAGDFRVYVKEAEMLAKCGIASFRFDFRGCGDSEGDWIDMTIGREVSDAMKALDVVDNLSGNRHIADGVFRKIIRRPGGCYGCQKARPYQIYGSLGSNLSCSSNGASFGKLFKVQRRPMKQESSS